VAGKAICVTAKGGTKNMGIFFFVVSELSAGKLHRRILLRERREEE